MSRTSRSVPGSRPTGRLRLAAAVVAAGAAGLVLTGCSGTTHTGAAAVVDGDRITISTLGGKVAAVEDETGLSASPVAATRAQLSRLLVVEVVEEAGRRAGVHVTATEVAEQRRALEAASPESLTARAARQGVPASDIDTMIRRDIILDKIAAREGVTPESPRYNAVVSQVLLDTASSMSIKLNPRYGTWDPSQLSIGPQTYDWLTPAQEA